MPPRCAQLLLALGLQGMAMGPALAAEPASFDSIHDRVLRAGAIWCPPGFKATAENPSRRCGASIVSGAEVSRKADGGLMAAAAAPLYASGAVDADGAAFLVAHQLAHHVLGHQALRMQPAAQQAAQLLTGSASSPAATLAEMGMRLMYPQPRADMPKDWDAQERDADFLAPALLSLAGFRVAVAVSVLKSSDPEVIKQVHMPAAMEAREARIAKAGSFAQALCRQLAQKRPALPAADRFKPGYGVAPSEAEALKSMQQAIDHEHVCAGVPPP